MKFNSGFLDAQKERYSNPVAEMGDQFKESFERNNGSLRVLDAPSLDVLVNALMSGGKVSVTYVWQVTETPLKLSPVQHPGDPWRSAMVNVSSNEEGERSYLVEVKEHVKTVEMHVESLKTNIWERERGYSRSADLTWEAVLADQHYDTKGYQDYSWQTRLRLTFDGKTISAGVVSSS